MPKSHSSPAKPGRKKPGPKPLDTTFVLEDLVGDYDCRVIPDTNTLRSEATGEEITFDREASDFKDRLTSFLKRAAQAGAINPTEVEAWCDFLYDDCTAKTRDHDIKPKLSRWAGRAPQVYQWSNYNFEAF